MPGQAPPAQSFIIYIIGSSYPADHPILRYPDMNLSDDASYEDLLQLAAIIGPARPTTATQEAIDASGLELRTLNLSDLTADQMTDIGSNDESDTSVDEVLICDPPKAPLPTTTPSTGLKRKRSLSLETEKVSSKRVHLHPHLTATTGLEDLKSSERCSICLTDWEDKDIIRVLRCHHGFHRDCVDHWLREGADRCPVCRTDAVKLPSRDNHQTAAQPVPPPQI
jgi:hypothetical protein